MYTHTQEHTQLEGQAADGPCACCARGAGKEWQHSNITVSDSNVQCITAMRMNSCAETDGHHGTGDACDAWLCRCWLAMGLPLRQSFATVTSRSTVTSRVPAQMSKSSRASYLNVKSC